jgi:hypothetical protein
MEFNPGRTQRDMNQAVEKQAIFVPLRGDLDLADACSKTESSIPESPAKWTDRRNGFHLLGKN